MKRLIIFLIRKRLGIKKFESFKFSNQKEDCEYYFGSEALIKVTAAQRLKYSGVSLNWLLSDDCKGMVKKV